MFRGGFFGAPGGPFSAILRSVDHTLALGGDPGIRLLMLVVAILVSNVLIVWKNVMDRHWIVGEQERLPRYWKSSLVLSADDRMWSSCGNGED